MIWFDCVVFFKLCVIDNMVIFFWVISCLIVFIILCFFWGFNIDVVLFNIKIDGWSVKMFVIVICCFCLLDKEWGLLLRKFFIWISCKVCFNFLIICFFGILIFFKLNIILFCIVVLINWLFGFWNIILICFWIFYIVFFDKIIVLFIVIVFVFGKNKLFNNFVSVDFFELFCLIIDIYFFLYKENEIFFNV